MPKKTVESLQLSISREQYEALVQLLYLGDWVLHAHEVPDTRESGPHQEVMRSILSHAGELGARKLVDDTDGEPAPSRFLEDQMHPHIQAYDTQTMWEELIMALGERDAGRSLGPEALNGMPATQRVEALLKHEETWANEFEQHGLERIHIAGTSAGTVG